MKKVLGIGNALVDILMQIDNDQLLEKLELPKGSMQLVDYERAQRVLKATSNTERKQASGGSAANTISGLAEMKIKTSFIGKICEDEIGKVFYNDMLKSNIHPQLFYSKIPSGTATTLISKDSERTFATHLGAAIELSADDLKDENFEGYDYFYIEGYLVQNHQLIEKAVSMAKKHKQKVFLDLASYNVVEANLDFLKYIVKEYVDVVFANEEEAKAFTGNEPEEALNELSEMVDVAVVKIGKEGSLIKKGDETLKVGVIKTNSIDTTGAGDLYAAGFIYGMANNESLKYCGKCGAILAGNVIQNFGAKIASDKWENIKSSIKELND